MKMCSVHLVLILESVDKILWCEHSNETFLSVLLHGTICLSMLCKNKFEFFSNSPYACLRQTS